MPWEEILVMMHTRRDQINRLTWHCREGVSVDGGAGLPALRDEEMQLQSGEIEGPPLPTVLSSCIPALLPSGLSAPLP